MALTPAERAREALLLADADPRQAVDLARTAADVAHAQRDLVAGAVAARAEGLARAHLDDLDLALVALRRSVRLGRRGASTIATAEARMTLAYVLNLRGRPGAALRTIDLAMREARGEVRARARAQRGAILHQTGRLDAALVDYEAALPILARAGDTLWTARVLANRALIRGYRGKIERAIEDLKEAETLYRQLGLDLSVGHAEHNLGYFQMLRGDIPAALHHLDVAESCFTALGSQRCELLSVRAELLLSAHLIAEARDAAEQAVQACLSERRQAILPEARLILARTEQLRGDLAHALTQARAAARELTRLGHRELAALARVVTLTLQFESEVPAGGPAALERAISAAGRLWPEVALEGRLAAGRWALRHDRTDLAVETLARAGAARRRGTPLLRGRSWYAEALRRRTVGDDRGAQAAARAGLRILDEYAGALGATDVRAHVASYRFDLAALGMRIAMDAGSPSGTLHWAELARASHLNLPTVRPVEDPTMAEDLAALRVVTRDIDDLRSAGRTSTTLAARRSMLERRIRDQQRHARMTGGPRTPEPSLRQLSDALGQCALVEYIVVEGVLRAVTLVDGRLRLHDLGRAAPVIALAGQLPFALHRLARRSLRTGSQHAAVALLHSTSDQLDGVMLRPLPEITGRPLVIVPTLSLQWLPWAVLPSCAGRPLAVSPSATLWHAAMRRPPSSGRACAAAGPALGGARAEALAVARIYGVAPLIDGAATASAVAHGLAGASVAHLAAHGRVRADNPLFGSLRFADGPLMIYDLEQLEQAPHTVVVAACDAGRPVAPVGDELLGLTATLLARGTSQLVASVVPILDVETEPLMTSLHRALRDGMSAAHALARAQEETGSTGPAGVATAAGFLCFGAGFAPIFPIVTRGLAHHDASYS
jgi:hypothetical protein